MMAEGLTTFADRLDSLLARGVPFAAYRIPGERQVTLVTGTSTLLDAGRWATMPMRDCFVMAPFDLSATSVRILHCENEEVYPVETSAGMDTFCDSSLLMRDEETMEESRRAYFSTFNKFKEALDAGLFEKLVLSRCRRMECASRIRLSDVFCRAVNGNDDAFVYLCQFEQGNVWMGCTPEVLLQTDGCVCRTMALAGTREKDRAADDGAWNGKNRSEQQIVADYIAAVLQSLGLEYQRGIAHPAGAARLVHLRTDFVFPTPRQDVLRRLLQALHPTPAVCGLPKQEAMRFVEANEGYARTYYAGFLGRLKTGSVFDLFVNLRCVHLADGVCRFYAGGGILPSSVVEEEWEETEKKMRTMMDLFGVCHS